MKTDRKIGLTDRYIAHRYIGGKMGRYIDRQIDKQINGWIIDTYKDE